MSAVTTRAARLTDARRLAEIHIAAWRAAYRGIMADEVLDSLDLDRYTAGWTRSLGDAENPVDSFVVEEAGRILGMGGISPPRDPAEVLDRLPSTEGLGQLAFINLDPVAFGTGAAAVLFHRLEDELRGAGYARAYLMVAEGNDRAMRFYAKHGWVRTEITHAYDGVSPPVPEQMFTTELH